MLVITDLKKSESIDFVTLTQEELLILGGIVPFAANLVGAGLGATGSALGQVGYNAATNKPLNQGVLESTAIGGVFGAINPLGGAATFAGGAARAAGGTILGNTIFDASPALGGYREQSQLMLNRP
jgi:hypothetical protein